MYYHGYMNTNEQLTIRGVDEATKKRLTARARARGMSLNSYNLEVLRREAGTSEAKKTNGLERFSGITTFETKIEEALKEQRKVTPDKWDSYGI
jgi:plasmid stability protein